MPELLIKVVLSVVVTFCIKGGFALMGASIAWWIAVVAALVIAFAGWFIIVDPDSGNADSDGLGWD